MSQAAGTPTSPEKVKPESTSATPEPAKETMPETPEAHELSEEATPELIAKVPEEPEEYVTVTALEDTLTQQESDENPKKQSERKRRKFF
jgi:hypothetical protein